MEKTYLDQDAQAIAMANSSAEQRASAVAVRHLQQRRAQQLEEQAVYKFLVLITRLAIYLLAGILSGCAAQREWIAPWLAVLLIAVCAAAGALAVERYRR